MASIWALPCERQNGGVRVKVEQMVRTIAGTRTRDRQMVFGMTRHDSIRLELPRLFEFLDLCLVLFPSLFEVKQF